MIKNKILIFGAQQTYVKSYAGGYVRLREFIKRIPEDIDFKILDASPSIYKDIVNDDKLIKFEIPLFINKYIGKIFALKVLSERFYMAYVVYEKANNAIINEDIKMIYVPIGEFLHLYLPAIMLKRKHKKLKIVVDILNFRIIEENFYRLILKNKTPGVNWFMAIGLAIFFYISFKLTKKTINEVDYVFTVSPELVDEIKKIYVKKTIDYTPSGVSFRQNISIVKHKKYKAVYVGRVTEQKGIFNLIEVWKELITIDKSANLAIAGIVSKEIEGEIYKKITDYDLKGNIKIYGPVTEDEKNKLISESEVFLHLANYEPLFPVIGILEGLSYGLPCVLFDMSVLRYELKKIKNNNFLYVAPYGNTSQAVKLILSYLNSSSLEKQNVFKSARGYAKEFDWSSIASKEFNVISRLLSS